MLNVGKYIFFHGIAGNSKWSGISQINSGDASKTVSAGLVTSGYPIFVTKMSSGGGLTAVEVDSIVDGVSFAVKPTSGAAVTNIRFGWMAMGAGEK